MKRAMLFALLAFSFLSSMSKAETFNPTKAYKNHKGFMVFLNWYFGQPAPMIITKHFRKLKSEGAFSHYRGKYGAFHTVDVTVCEDKIMEVFARTKKLPRGISPLLKSWLEERLYKRLVRTKDEDNESSFFMAAKNLSSRCQSMTNYVIKTEISRKTRRF